MSEVVYKRNGKVVTKEQFLAGSDDSWDEARAHVQAIRSNKPLASESSGVLPRQVAKARKKLARLQEHGLLTGVRLEDNGVATFTSAGEQGRVGWMRYRKKVDYDGGYRETYTDDGRYGD